MTRVRFATARALFETFPKDVTRIASDPTDEAPFDYLKGLVSRGKIEDAVSFCAHLLPRRETVWWACRSARALLGSTIDNKARGLVAAEAWVRSPDSERMQDAREFGTVANPDDPMTWLALAAGWSGGMLLSHPSAPVPVPPYMSARCTYVGILLCSRAVDAPQRTARLSACIDDGMKLAETGL